MDSPPPALVERVAQAYLRSGGDLTATYRALFESPEFWSDAARASKVKTPLEFTISAVRALGGTTAGDVPMVQALDRMGQPLYRAQPPTGWPEVSQPWVNPGALVARIDFGLKLASGRITGTEVPLPPVDGPPDQVVDRTARAILHRPLGEQTRSTVLAALGASERHARRRASPHRRPEAGGPPPRQPGVPDPVSTFSRRQFLRSAGALGALGAVPGFLGRALAASGQSTRQGAGARLPARRRRWPLHRPAGGRSGLPGRPTDARARPTRQGWRRAAARRRLRAPPRARAAPSPLG